MIRVELNDQIDRPSDEVFSYLSDFRNNPQWQSGMREIKITSDGPLAVGSTYDQVASFLGRDVISSFEVIDYEPGRLVKATSRAGSFPITFTRRVAPLDNGSDVTAVIEGDSTGFFKLAEPLMQRVVQRSIRNDYRKLKEVLEV